jgi:tetratricopeptide (TPR) repeat protein
MGYAYLSLDQLSDAMEYFGIYCQSDTKNAEKHLDALFQLSDGNYQQGKDEQAILYYKKIIALNSDLTDRALFYLAKSYGYNKQAALKISTLESLLSTYPNSKYVQNATYELAMSFKSQSEFNKAYAYFEKYLDQYPQSPKRVNCRIEMADIYYKQGNYELSEGAYRSILMEYGNKPDICAVAAKGLMDVYLTLKKPESAEQVANEYDCAGLSSDEKENLYYNPALQSYVIKISSGEIRLRRSFLPCELLFKNPRYRTSRAALRNVSIRTCFKLFRACFPSTCGIFLRKQRIHSSEHLLPITGEACGKAQQH